MPFWYVVYSRVAALLANACNITFCLLWDTADARPRHHSQDIHNDKSPDQPVVQILVRCCLSCLQLSSRRLASPCIILASTLVSLGVPNPHGASSHVSTELIVLGAAGCALAQDVKTIKTADADGTKPDRYRLQISDGDHKHLSAMLATQMNTLVTEEKIKKNAIVRLLKYVCNTVNNRRIIIIINAEVINSDLGHRIGDPINVSKDTKRDAAAQPPPAAQPPADVKPDISKPVSTKPYPIAAQRTSPSNPYQRRRESFGHQVAGDGPVSCAG